MILRSNANSQISLQSYMDLIQDMFAENKYEIYSLVIEVTRRCNMKCAHCLRGEAQNMDIDTEYIDRLLSHVSRISNITFSGGEPSLNLSAIRYTLEYCKSHNISVGSFFVATNGKNDPRELGALMHEWYVYCDEDDDEYGCQLTISTDAFHEPVNQDHYRWLQGYSFYSDIKTVDYDHIYLIDEGRAKNLSGYRKIPSANRTEDPDIVQFDRHLFSIQNLIYLSCNGEIRTNCDLAFDNTSATIGNLRDDDFDDIMADYIEEDA